MKKKDQRELTFDITENHHYEWYKIYSDFCSHISLMLPKKRKGGKEEACAGRK